MLNSTREYNEPYISARQGHTIADWAYVRQLARNSQFYQIPAQLTLSWDPTDMMDALYYVCLSVSLCPTERGPPLTESQSTGDANCSPTNSATAAKP